MKPRTEDLRDLAILHQMDHEGATAAEVAARRGKSRSAILGIRKRINDAADLHGCACLKPENMDGGMPPKWWAK